MSTSRLIFVYVFPSLAGLAIGWWLGAVYSRWWSRDDDRDQ